MMRSLFSGVSGMQSYQSKMDVVANNIANVGTTGFKAGRMSFKEAVVQTERGASRPSGAVGGTNAQQIGLGVDIGAVSTDFGQGVLERTGRATDLAIEGDGFFVIGGRGGFQYTRDGQFDFDAEGRLVSLLNGGPIKGVMADQNGNVVMTGALEDIIIPDGLQMPAEATTLVNISGNLDAGAAVGTIETLSFTVYDSIGSSHVVNMQFEKIADGQWDWSADIGGVNVGSGSATFGAQGELTGMTGSIAFAPTNGAQALAVNFDANGAQAFAGLTQFASETTVAGSAADGAVPGILDRITIDPSGIIYGAFSNGRTRALAQVALARFSNPAGLDRIGGNMYQISANSGEVQIGTSADFGAAIRSESLEASNVDLTAELTNMIVTQRAFQANARVISTSDELLQEVAALKR